MALGGSHALGRADPASDWDLGVYYRDSRQRLDPGDIRALGYAGEVSDHGGWGPIMLGGAWLTVGGPGSTASPHEREGVRVDVHYRDLDLVERWLADAQEGRFQVHVQGGYLVGAPTYVLVGELAVAQVLHGHVERVQTYPPALRQSASRYWSGTADFALAYASTYVDRADPVGCDGCLIRAVLATAHARLAQRGEWVLNEKRLVTDAGLTGARPVLASVGANPQELRSSVDTIARLVSAHVAATGERP
ncbi:nucleotidyltransferase domain-containing protein [soil metagenome]